MAPFVIGNNGAYDPAYLRSAYNLTQISASAGGGQTVAIVDAYDDPSAESDLATYRTRFGLSPCTTANGCFRKVNQSGVQGSYPAASSSWAQEIALDVDMVSAICPNCKILLVEATSNSLPDLGQSVNTAAALGANAISNSYGGGEFSIELNYEQNDYYHPGIAVTVSSGDSGYGVEFPAASQYVTAVGGTTLNQASNGRGWTETAWSGAGAGCSAYEPKPTWQTDTGCSRRTVADVSAVADPNTGVWVYVSGSWYVFGGTSVASPIVASVYALAANSSVTFGSFPYKSAASLWDVVGGSDGSCGGSYLCTAVSGYDGPTGLGTPNGVNAFKASGGTQPANPTISSVAPTSGTTAGGTNVTITGTNFAAGASVTFGGTAASSVTVASSTSISATTPAHPAGAVDVVVSSSGQTATLSSGYTYLAPTASTFSIASSASQSSSQGVTAGQPAQYTVTLSTSNGYASPVNLSVSGLPAGTTASFNPASLTPTSSGANATLTVTTANGAPLGTYTLTITGTGTDSAATKASTTATLVLRNYWMSASAYTVTLKAGTSGSVLVYANTTSGDYLQVGLAASGLPSGATASFNPRTITTGSPGTTPSTLTISTSTATPAGTYKLGVTGTDSAGDIRYTFINLVVQ